MLRESLLANGWVRDLEISRTSLSPMHVVDNEEQSVYQDVHSINLTT